MRWAPWLALLAAEAVALHDAGEALALADGGDVDPVAVGEQVDLELLADLVAGHVVEAQLDERGARLDAGLLEVAGLGLGELARPSCWPKVTWRAL